MVRNTSVRVKQDALTIPNGPTENSSILHSLTNIHKQTLVRRPIISGYDGLTECLSSFADKLHQPIAQMQDSYLQDTTHFIKFIESANRVPGNALLVSMDVQPVHEYPTVRRPYFSMQARNTKNSLTKTL